MPSPQKAKGKGSSLQAKSLSLPPPRGASVALMARAGRARSSSSLCAGAKPPGKGADRGSGLNKLPVAKPKPAPRAEDPGAACGRRWFEPAGRCGEC